MKKRSLVFISLLSGLLMTLSWINVMSLGFLMLIAFIPLLFVEDYIANNNSERRFSSSAAFTYSFPAFFIFTFTNTWWISNASAVGYVVPVAEAAFMSVIFQLYSFSKRIADNKQGAYFFIVFYWIAFEFLQFKWDINFPWLNLGNSFAAYPQLIQWYSVTGMEGGTLWILLSNILIYFLIITTHRNKAALYGINLTKEFSLSSKEFSKKSSFFGKYKYWIFAVLILAAPITWSLILWIDYEDEYSQTADVLVVQPNLDPYNEQYVLSPQEVIARVENLAAPQLDEKTDFLVLPESCIQEYAWEDRLVYVPSIEELKSFTSKAANCQVIAGISTQKLLPQGQKTQAARPIANHEGLYYESCNTALMFNKYSSQKDIQSRHKSVLVVGVEKLPFKKYLPFIEKLALNMGGTVGSLGTDKTAVNFFSADKQIKVGVPICWESIDGNYCREFVNSGAYFLQVITNVGWWGDTPGYKQYFAISRLRAIENRRYVCICANTGFSGLVNAKGQVVDKGKYWQQEVFKYAVPQLNRQTFFTTHGDIIMRPLCFFAILLLAYSIVRNKTKIKGKIK